MGRGICYVNFVYTYWTIPVDRYSYSYLSVYQVKCTYFLLYGLFIPRYLEQTNLPSIMYWDLGRPGSGWQADFHLFLLSIWTVWRRKIYSVPVCMEGQECYYLPTEVCNYLPTSDTTNSKAKLWNELVRPTEVRRMQVRQRSEAKKAQRSSVKKKLAYR